MKTRLKILTGLVFSIFLTTSLTLVALAETSTEDETLFNPEEVGLTPGGVGMLAIITVMTTTDGLNDGDGFCSLREAILAANTDAPVDACLQGNGSDTINLMAGTYVLTHANGALQITSTITISGIDAGSTIIDGNGGSTNDRVFWIRSRGQATISNVTITNGSASKGGGIRNEGVLQLTDSIVFSNTAKTSDGGGIINEGGVVTITASIITGNKAEGGGGIFNESGTITINNSTVSQNTATAPSGVPPAPEVGLGGGLANSAETADATLTVNQSMITTNTVVGLGGGGLSNSADLTHTATVILNQTVVSDNTAEEKTTVNANEGFGGGIRNGFFDTATTAKSIITVNDSTVSGNTAINGGGIANGTTLTTPTTLTLEVTVNNSTVSSNTTVADSATLVGNGGGLVNVNGTTLLVNSTVSGNAANGGDATGGRGGGIFSGNFNNKATTLWLTNTTISSNTAQISAKGDGVASIETVTSTTTSNFKNSIIAGGCLDFATTIVSHGNNLVDDGNTCNLTATGDITNTDPLLGPLQNNGGDTETHALLEGSPALGAGDQSVCAAAPVSNLDQRGVTRPATDAACDIGSFESSFKAPAGNPNVYLPIVIKS